MTVHYRCIYALILAGFLCDLLAGHVMQMHLDSVMHNHVHLNKGLRWWCLSVVALFWAGGVCVREGHAQSVCSVSISQEIPPKTIVFIFLLVMYMSMGKNGHQGRYMNIFMYFYVGDYLCSQC